MPPRSLTLPFLLAASCLASAAPISNQPVVNKQISYSDVADAVTRAPIVALITISKASRLRDELAPGLTATDARFLITAKVNGLLRGEGGLPAQIEYIVDVPLDGANRPPKLKKQRMIVAATPVAGKPGAVRLVSRNAHIPLTPDAEAKARAILTELVSPNAAPPITGVGNAFHVRGSIPGESESQIFLKTVDGSPISLSVLRRPGEQTRWAVSLSEMVDDTAAPPRPETLLWYRLACSLPESLPDSSVALLDQEDSTAANQDYQFIKESLGPCRDG